MVADVGTGKETQDGSVSGDTALSFCSLILV